ncbi:hypothetical protein ACFC1T_02290 [Kitasatospora sp. NPDC056076]|uniref:hypothetical protein n=1 Tax=Kitasatospora sp. NPDC056076 TaxID=3345703 RepID=UPI0035D9B724
MDRNPPTEFHHRYTGWQFGTCFKCERAVQVTVIGELTVGAVAVQLDACLACAWKLERLHHNTRPTSLHTGTAAAFAVAYAAARRELAA